MDACAPLAAACLRRSRVYAARLHLQQGFPGCGQPTLARARPLAAAGFVGAIRCLAQHSAAGAGALIDGWNDDSACPHYAVPGRVTCFKFCVSCTIQVQFRTWWTRTTFFRGQNHGQVCFLRCLFHANKFSKDLRECNLSCKRHLIFISRI